MECLGYMKSASSLPQLNRILGGDTSNTNALDFGASNCLTLNCYSSGNDNGSNAGRNRRPITALWNSKVSDLREVFGVGGGGNANTSTFYVDEAKDEAAAEAAQRFHEDIHTLHRRQTMLFQRSCEQLLLQEEENGQATNASANSCDESSSSSAITNKSKTAKRKRLASMPRRLASAPPLPSPFAHSTTEAEAEELYSKCLFAVMHMIGCDADRENQWRLVEHLRKAFR